MHRRKFLVAMGAAAGGVVLASCEKQIRPVQGSSGKILPVDELPPSRRITLKMSGEDAGGLAPFVVFPSAYGLMLLIYDTLLYRDSSGRMLNWLASRHQTSPDRLTHVFDLRRDVRWHDGTLFTAEDVAFTFNYWTEQEAIGQIQPWVIFRPKHVIGAKALDTYKVELQLDKPIVTFVDEVASRVPIVPKHVWQPLTRATMGQDQRFLVGTGPYRLKSYGGDGRGGYLFEANDRFFLGKPFVKRLEMPPVANQLLALKAGEIDLAGIAIDPVNAKAVKPFKNDPTFGVLKGPPGGIFTVLNWNLAARGALADVQFRRACAMAINRKEMVERLLGGNGHPGNPGFLAPGHPFRVPVEQYEFNPAGAQRLLDSAGYRPGPGGIRIDPAGKALRFTMKGPKETYDAAELVIAMLKQVGIEVTFALVAEEFTLRSYEMALFIAGGAGAQDDPGIMRLVYSSRQPDNLFFAAAGYENPQFDDLADKQLVAAELAERKQAVAGMQQIVAEDLPLLHLFYPTPFFIFRKSVFDQWQWAPQGTPQNKTTLITGVATGGTKIRPIKQ